MRGGFSEAPTISRSVASSQSGIAGPPYVMLPIGRGWLRMPSQPAPLTSSAPARAVASGVPSRWATSWPTGWLVPSCEDSTLTAKAVTRPSVALVSGSRKLRRGLSSTTTFRGGGFGEGHQPYRAGCVFGVVGSRPGPSGIRMDVIDDPAVFGDHTFPAIIRDCVRPTTGRRDNDGVDGTCGFDYRAQRVSGVAEAVSDADGVTGDGPRLERCGNRRCRVVGCR